MERKDTNTTPTNTSVFLTAVRHAVRDVCVRHVAFSVGVAVTGLLCVDVDGGEHQVQFVLNEVISKTGSETAGDGNSTSYCLKSNSLKQRPDSPRRHHGGYYRKRSWTAKANKRKSSIPVATPQLSRRCLTEQSATGFHHTTTTTSAATSATQATPESVTSESPSPMRCHQQHQHHHQQQGRHHHHHHPLLSRVQLATPLTRNKSPPTKPPRGGAPTTQPLLLSASRDLRSSRTFTIEDDEDDDSSCVDCKSSIYSDTAARSAVGGGLGLGVDRGGGVSLGVGVSGSQQKQNVVENVKTSQQQHKHQNHQQHQQQYGAKFRSSRFTAAAGSASRRYARDVSGGKPVLNRSGSNIFGRRGTDESPRDTVTCPLMDDVHSSLYCPSVSDVGTFTDSDVDGRSWNSFSYNSLRDETNSRSSITQGGSAHNNVVRPSPDLGLSCESETDRPSQKTRSCINRSSINTGPSRTFKGTKGSNPFVTRDRNIPHWQKSCDTSSSTRLVSSSSNAMKDKELLQPRQKRHLELKQNLAAAHLVTLRETLSDSAATCRNVERQRHQRRDTVSDSMACPPPNMQTRLHRQETKSETKSPNLDDNDKRRRDDCSASSLCEANTTTTLSQTCQRDSEDASQQQYGGHHRAFHAASPESVSAAAPRRDCSSGTDELQHQKCCSFRHDDAGGESMMGGEAEVMDAMEGVPPSPFSRDGEHDASLCDLRENASTGGSEVCESPSAIVKKKAKRFKWMKFFKKESSSYRQQEGAHTNLPAHEQASPLYGHHHHHDAKRTSEQCQRGTL